MHDMILDEKSRVKKFSCLPLWINSIIDSASSDFDARSIAIANFPTAPERFAPF